MRSPLSEFCKKRGVPDKIRDAFGAYARSVYADRFLLRHDTDTVRLLISRLSEEQMLKMWNEFINDLKAALSIPKQDH